MNNTQRKMLDGIVTARYKEIRKISKKVIDANYENQRNELIAKYEKKFSSVVKAGQRYYELVKVMEPELKLNGLSLNYTLSGMPHLTFSRYYHSNANKEDLALETARDRAYQLIVNVESEIRELIWSTDKPYDEIKEVIEKKLSDMEVEYDDGKKS